MIALVFDTETTDLLHNPLSAASRQPHIVEFNGQLVNDDGEVIRELDFLCRPGKAMEADAQRVTGITDAMLADRPPFAEFAGGVADLIGQAQAVVAHNLDFDLKMLDLEFRRLGLPLVLPPWQICTVNETQWIKGKRLKLNELYQLLFDRNIREAHRAKNDVDALVEIWNELRKRQWL